MLEPIDDRNISHAFDLLARGFQHRPVSFWERAIERIARYNRQSDQGSVGSLLVAKGAHVGIMLTLRGRARDENGNAYDVTNLSSWYVDPEHRRLAPLMLREIVRDDKTVFTDLTPSAEVARMLPLLGFRPLNAGIAAIALPLAALRRGGSARMSSLEAIDPRTVKPADRSLLERNAEFGAMAAILSDEGKDHPLLFVSRTIRHLPAVELIYCGDTRALMKNIHTAARFLLKQGKLVLIVDIPLDTPVRGEQFVGRAVKFAKGASEGCSINRTDYAGSELLLVGY